MPEYSGLTFIQLDEANRPSALGVMGDGDTFTSSVLDADTKETTRYTKETSAGIKGTSGTVFDNSASWGTGGTVSAQVSYQVLDTSTTVFDNSSAWGSGGTPSAGVVYSVMTTSGTVFANSGMWGGGLTDIVDDTSPQLGGTLDGQGNLITGVTNLNWDSGYGNLGGTSATVFGSSGTWGGNSTPSAGVSYSVLDTSTTVFDNSTAWSTNNVVSAGVVYSVLDTSTTVFDNSGAWGSGGTPSAGVVYSVSTLSGVVFDTSTTWGDNSVPSAGVSYSVLDTSTTVFDNSASWGAGGTVSAGVVYSVSTLSGVVFDSSTAWGTTDIVLDVTPVLGGHLDADMQQIINVRKVLGASAGAGQDFDISANVTTIKGQGLAQVSGTDAVRLSSNNDTGFQLVNSTDNWTGDMVSSLHAVDQVTDTVTDNSGAWGSGGTVSAGVVYSVSTLSGVVFDTSTTWGANSTPSAGVVYSVLDTSTTVFDNSAAWGTNNVVSDGVVYSVSTVSGVVFDTSTTWGANSTPSAGVSYSVLDTSTTVFDNSATWGANSVPSAGVVYSVLDTSTTVFDNSAAWGAGLTDIVQDITPALGGHLDADGKQIINVRKVLGVSSTVGADLEVSASFVSIKGQGNTHVSGVAAVRLACDTETGFQLLHPTDNWTGDMVSSLHSLDQVSDTVTDNSATWGVGTVSAGVVYSVSTLSGVVFDTSTTWGANSTPSAGVVYSVLDTSTTVFDNSAAWGAGLTDIVDDTTPQLGGTLDCQDQQLFNVSSIIGRDTLTLGLSGQNVELLSNDTLKLWSQDEGTGSQVILAAANSTATSRFGLSTPDATWVGDMVSSMHVVDSTRQTVLANSSNWFQTYQTLYSTSDSMPWPDNTVGGRIDVDGVGTGTPYKPVDGAVPTFRESRNQIRWAPATVVANFAAPQTVYMGSSVTEFTPGPAVVSQFDNRVLALSGLTVSGGMDASGSTNFYGEVCSLSGLGVSGGLDVLGNGSWVGDIDLVGGVSVTGTTTLRDTNMGGDLSVTGTIDSTGDMTCVQTLQGRNCIATHSLTTNSVATFNGVTSATAGLNVAGGLDVTGTTTLINDLNVSGDIISEGNLDLDSNLTMGGGTLNASGAEAVFLGVDCSSLTVSPYGTSLEGALDVTGITTLKASTGVSGILQVKGNLEVTGTVSALGAHNIKGQAYYDNSTIIVNKGKIGINSEMPIPAPFAMGIMGGAGTGVSTVFSFGDQTTGDPTKVENDAVALNFDHDGTFQFNYAEGGFYKIEASLIVTTTGAVDVNVTVNQDASTIFTRVHQLHTAVDPLGIDLLYVVQATGSGYVKVEVDSTTSNLMNLEAGSTCMVTRIA